MNTSNSWYTLIYIIHEIPLIRDLILNTLCASDCASLLALTGYDLNNQDIKKFLHPLRDIFNNIEDTRFYIADNLITVMIGKDLDLLLNRIKSPLIFWELHPIPIEINVLVLTLLTYTSQESGQYQQICHPLHEEMSGDPDEYRWQILRSSNGSNVNRLRCENYDSIDRHIAMTLGVDWQTEVNRQYITTRPIYNDLSLCLVYKRDNMKYCTKYIDLSKDGQKLQHAEEHEVFEDVEYKSRYIQLEVYNRDPTSSHDISVIQFPIGK